MHLLQPSSSVLLQSLRVIMQLFIVMLLVTRLQILRGLEKVQDKLCQQTRYLSLKPLKAMDLAVMNVLLGMALGTTAPTPVQLTYTVSKK